MFWKILILLSLIIGIFDYLIIKGADILKTPQERLIDDEEQEKMIKEYVLKKEIKHRKKRLERERKRKLKYEKINNRRKAKCGKRNCKSHKSNTKE